MLIVSPVTCSGGQWPMSPLELFAVLLWMSHTRSNGFSKTRSALYCQLRGRTADRVQFCVVTLIVSWAWANPMNQRSLKFSRKHQCVACPMWRFVGWGRRPFRQHWPKLLVGRIWRVWCSFRENDQNYVRWFHASDVPPPRDEQVRGTARCMDTKVHWETVQCEDSRPILD